MAETTARTCPQDCRQCNFQQHAYCSAQMALSAFKVYEGLSAKLDEIETAVKDLKSQSELATPIVDEKPKHSDGGGVENRPPIIENE
jgi:hypothetical protein